MNSLIGMKLFELFFPKLVFKLCSYEWSLQVEADGIFMMIFEGKRESIKIKGIWVDIFLEWKNIKLISIVD